MPMAWARAIKKFIQSNEVSDWGGSRHIEEKKVETEEEMKVARAFAFSRVGHGYMPLFFLLDATHGY